MRAREIRVIGNIMSAFMCTSFDVICLYAYAFFWGVRRATELWLLNTTFTVFEGTLYRFAGDIYSPFELLSKF